MNRQFRINAFLLALLPAILLAACGTSPPVHYYSLEPSAGFETRDGPGAAMIGMGPLRLPDYLKRTRIVTRGPGNEIRVHEEARWAEPPNDAIHRVLAANVDAAFIITAFGLGTVYQHGVGTDNPLCCSRPYLIYIHRYVCHDSLLQK